MRVPDRTLSAVLLLVLCANLILMVAMGLDTIQASRATRWQWAIVGTLGIACILQLRALTLTGELRRRFAQLRRVNRVIGE